MHKKGCQQPLWQSYLDTIVLFVLGNRLVLIHMKPKGKKIQDMDLIYLCISHLHFSAFLSLSPPGWRGIVVTVRAGGCQTCGTLISVTTWRIFSIRSSVELSRLVFVHCHGHMPIFPIWACPWAKNFSNMPQIGSRLCRTHISETAGWIYPIESFLDLSRPVVVQHHSYLPICPMLAHERAIRSLILGLRGVVVLWTPCYLL